MKADEPFVPLSDRARLLTLGAQPHLQKGLEFGALNNPIVRPGQGDIRFVDYTSSDALRAYPHADSINKNSIVNVDYVWSGSGSLAEVINTGEQFDYAIASHVIEHVPNVVGWFQGIFDTLRPGAVFNLAIPDKRYTFDVRRKLTTLGDIVEAHLLQFSFPSIRQMFDHCYDAIAIEPGAVWKHDIDIKSVPRLCGDLALQLAYDQALQILKCQRYFDSHCLIVTPISFLDLIEGLSNLGLFSFRLSGFQATAIGDFEFFVQLEKPAGMNAAELLNQQISSIKAYREKILWATRIAALQGDCG